MKRRVEPGDYPLVLLARSQLTAADLSAFVDGDLGWWRHRRIARHLDRCEPCRRYVEQVAGVVGHLRKQDPAPTLSPTTTADLQRVYAQWAATRQT